MSAPLEIVVSSDATGQMWNVCMWDAQSGTTLMTYKGGVSAANTLNFIGTDYLISAQKDKPLLHVWALNRREQMQVRMVCRGRVLAMTISPDGAYCVGAIGEKIHVWQVASGRLLAILSRHYQNVTCLAFTREGSHFVSCGEDGMSLVWPLVSVISQSGDFSQKTAGQADPRHIWSDHSLPITGLCVGGGGIKARVATVSLDQTCKLYDLVSGQLLVSVVFDDCLSAVTMDPAEYHAFAGSVKGDIYQFNIFSPPRTMEYHITEEKKQGLVFIGHTKPVTCLSVSMDGQILLSGSQDFNVMLWDISSQQCIRTLPHKGSITNAFFMLAPLNIFSEKINPSVVVSSFQRQRDIEDTTSTAVEVLVKEKQSHDKREEGAQKGVSGEVVSVSDVNLHDVITNLKGINKELFNFSAQELLNRYEKEG